MRVCVIYNRVKNLAYLQDDSLDYKNSNPISIEGIGISKEKTIYQQS
jgi:hypothetical protein